MKIIGLIGGMSWESTIPYYKIINEEIKTKLGGFHSAKIILYSVDFDEIEKCQSSGNWKKSALILGDGAKKLEMSGADFILICTNTMHKVYTQIQSMVKIPVIHIADATVSELEKKKIFNAGLLGTKYTLTQTFYKQRLIEHGINVIIPNEEDIEQVNKIIFQELCVGKIEKCSKKKMIEIMTRLKKQGADGIILGCTEIGLLVKQGDFELPLFDTTEIHAKYAAELAL